MFTNFFKKKLKPESGWSQEAQKFLGQTDDDKPRSCWNGEKEKKKQVTKKQEQSTQGRGEG